MLPPIWNGTLREHYLLLFGAGGVVAALTGSAAAWIGAQFGARRAAQAAAVDAVRLTESALARQLESLQHAVECTAIEVERIAEAQRFTARLLTDRGMPELRHAIPRSEARVVTPH